MSLYRSLLVIASPFVAAGLLFSIGSAFHTVKAQPKPQAQAAEPVKPKADPPFYGTTFYSGVLSSAYYYPQGPDEGPSSPVTHLKFNFSDERDLWICGDVRSKFEVGRKVRLIVSSEPNTPCVTNWKLR